MSVKYSVVCFDIDTQRDFMDPGGALYVPGALEIVPNLRRLFSAALQQGIPIISTADYHAPDDPEFDTFPPHCVRGTPGQKKISDTIIEGGVELSAPLLVGDLRGLLSQHQQIVLLKETIDIWTSPAVRQVLVEVEADAWYVFGVATEYCVKSAALGLAKAGKATYVVADAVRAITLEGERQAIEEMRAAGVRFVTTDEVVGKIVASSGNGNSHREGHEEHEGKRQERQ